jgi:nitric oxide reductase NorE protein
VASPRTIPRSLEERGAPRDVPPRPVHLPGEVGIWIFILGDMVVFGLFFGVFTYERSRHPAVFDHARDTLHVGLGALNTLLLLSGSLFVVRAVQALRKGQASNTRRWLAPALGCGLLFSIDKAIEWTDLLSSHHGPEVNDFYMYFFMFTAVHFLHLLIGLAALIFMWRSTRKAYLTRRDLRALESAGVYWHLVDLLWVVLFALLYLMS